MSMNDGFADVEAIKKLKARYFRLMDTKNWTEWRNIFTDDLVAVVDLAVSNDGEDGQSQTFEGGDSFTKMVSELATMKVHHGHMPEITLTGETTATGIWAMEDIVTYTDGRTLRGYGHYHEVYRKESGEWRITRLHLTRLRIDCTGPWPESGTP